MIADVDERRADGEIATIFAEVRDLWGVPYVSAIHRHMASRPGLLEWAWDALKPAFHNGQAQDAAAAAAMNLDVEELEVIEDAVLRIWRIDLRQASTARAVAENFVRVAPTNMMFAALLQRTINEGMTIAPATQERTWQPPPPLPALPDMVDIEELGDDSRDAIMRFAAQMGGKPFVPGLYRMLANWPGLLAHLATVLPPVLASSRTQRAYDQIRERIDGSAAGFVLARPVADLARPKPSDEELEQFQAIAKTYRNTSPEMIVAGNLIGAALGGASS